MRSTPSADRVLGRLLDQLFSELAKRAVAQRLVGMDGVVQRGEVTPTGPLSRTSARFFTPGIPGLDPLFTSMKRSRRRTAGFCAARGTAERQSVGWSCQSGCSIGPHAC